MTGDPDLAGLEAALGHHFLRPDLLAEALTHRSVGNLNLQRGGRKGTPSYERLEFLGDRVLGLVVAEMLLTAFPLEPEGDLARRHAALVRKETLAAVALDLALQDWVRLPAIEQPAARSNPSLLADVGEAVIAALYLDGGFDVARRFVRAHWTDRMLAMLAPPKDSKTALQEWVLARGRALPSYHLLRSDGPPHQPNFTVEVRVKGVGVAEGSGASKRLAETAAAAILLDRLRQGESS